MRFELDNVGFSYTSKSALPRSVFTRLHLLIDSGECVAIIGEEGAGKSTLLQLLNGLLRPQSGRVMVDGRDLWQEPSQTHLVRRRIGFAFQFPEQQFFCETVRDELLFAAKNFRTDMGDENCLAALSSVGLSAAFLSRSPFSLSMGEARRVALASILVLDPDVFLLDEPTAGLDGFGMELVSSLLEQLRTKHKTLVFASHDRDLVERVATRTITLADGTVRADLRVTPPGIKKGTAQE